jgi:hypothetical protein
MNDRCEVSRCRNEAAISYLDHGVCEKHWTHLTAEDAPPDALRISLGIEATAPTAKEATMEPTVDKSTKKSKKTKTAKPKEPKQKAPKEPLVVFAFRLSEVDRDLIHKAAGPAKATKFVRSAALAAAHQDSKAFDELVAQAKSNLK